MSDTPPTTDPKPADPPTPPTPPADPPKPDEQKPDTKTMTQAELDQMGKRERAAGRTAQEKAMLERLGVENIDEAERVLKAFRDAETAKQSEAERAKADADAARAKADKAEADAKALVRKTAVDRGLIRAKVSDDVIDDAAALVERELADTADPDDDAIATAVEAVKKRVPALFESAGDPAANGDPKKPPASNPGGTPPAPKGGGSKLADAIERGKAAAGSRGGVSAMVTASNTGAES